MTHENLEPEFISPIIIESDNPTRPFTESRLRRRKIGGKTLKRLNIDSYGPRNLKHPEKGGWYLAAAGMIIVTAVGIDHFRNHHGEDE